MFWRSAQPKQAPAPAMPKLSLERFLADPTPLVPSPRGGAVPFATGNVEMWPPPNCEDVLPPVGGQLNAPRHDMAMPPSAMAAIPAGMPPAGMPAMPAGMPPAGMPAMPASMPPAGMPAMPAGMPPAGMPAMPAMPLSGASEHFAVATSQPAATMAFASTVVASSSTVVGTGASSLPTAVASTVVSSSTTVVGGGNTGTNVIAWMDTGSKPSSTGRRCSSGMPNLPPTAAPAPRDTAATAAEVVSMGKLPPTWTSTVQEDPEEDPVPETMELSGSGEMMQEAAAEDEAQADEESTREDLLSKLKLAKQALLWERAVTQRLRSQLDMAEAWSPPDSEEEVQTLKSQIASLLEENKKLKEEAEASSSDGEETEALQAEVRDAQAQIETLEAKLTQSQAELEVAQEQLQAEKAELEATEQKLKNNQVEVAKELRQELQNLRDVMQQQQKAADEQVAAAKAEADALRTALATAETDKAAAAKATEEEAKVIRGAVEELKKKLQEQLQEGEERSAKEAAQRSVEEDLREQLRKMQLGASDHENAEEDLRAQLRKMEAGASDKDKVEEDLRAQLQKMEAGASDHETVAEDLRAQLRKMEAGASDKDKVEEDLRAQLRKMEAGASDHESLAEDLRAQLRKMEAGASDKDKVEEDLRAKLRKMEAGASDHENVEEDLREQLRKMETTAADHENVEENLRLQLRKMEAAASEQEEEKVQLRHVQTRNAELENELQEFQQVQLRKAKLKDVDVAVQTDAAELEKGVRSARQKKKSVFFNTAPGSESSIPGAVEHAVSETRSQRAHFKSVDFGQHDEDVSYTPVSDSEDDDAVAMSAMTSRTSMMSQASEYYDMYNETSQPARHRARSTIETYSEEDLWDPEHVAMVTRKLFPKHDKDRTGRIDWASGEAKKFLEELFWLHKQPPPKIPNAPFQSLYDQVKTDNEGYDDTDDKGLNVEEMTAFAIKVHQFVYKQLGKEMREQRKSFAVTEEELATLHRASIEMQMGEDAQATAARMMRRNTIMATPDLSGLTEKE